MVVPDTDNRRKHSAGPHGLGDPEDTFLRIVEKDVLIPKIIRERSRKEKCFEEFKAFSDCAREQGLKIAFKCKQQNQIFKDCLIKWWHDEEFRDECKKQYLQERAEYRRTGLGKKEREFIKNNSQ